MLNAMFSSALMICNSPREAAFQSGILAGWLVFANRIGASFVENTSPFGLGSALGFHYICNVFPDAESVRLVPAGEPRKFKGKGISSLSTLTCEAREAWGCCFIHCHGFLGPTS